MRDIDRIIERLSIQLPEIQIRQLEVSHPGIDDDGVWFMRLPGRKGEVQVESSSGSCPFLIEADCTDEKFTGENVDGVVQTVCDLFGRCPVD
jgi:hypothetical protein